MSLVPVKYPLDLTGAAASNRVSGEAYQLPSTNIRVFVPRYGAFFTDSAVVRDAATNRTLIKDVHWYAGLLYVLPTEQTGREIHQIIIITDPTCGPNVLFDAQMLGGEYSYSYDAIVQLVDRLALDNRPIAFDNIIGKPDGFDPAPHLHDVGDVYGFEFMTAALDRVRDAILLGSSAGQKGIYDFLDAKLAEMQITLDLIRGMRSTARSITDTLGYTPLDSAGGTVTGPLITKGPVQYQASVRTKVKSVTATTAQTTLDLSASNEFVLTLSGDTTMKFDTAGITGITGTDKIKFSLLVKNDNTPNRQLLWPASVLWPSRTEPVRWGAAGGVNEYEFSTYDGGVTWYAKRLTSV